MYFLLRIGRALKHFVYSIKMYKYIYIEINIFQDLFLFISKVHSAIYGFCLNVRYKKIQN